MEQRAMDDRRMDPHPLTPRLEGVEKRLDRMETKLDQIVSIETAIREMSIISGTFRKEIDKVWERVDDHSDWRGKHIEAEAEEHAAIVKSVTDAASTFGEYINQSKGRDRVILWAIGAAQAVLVSVTGYQFHSNQDQEHRLTVIEQKIEQLIKK